MEKSNVVLAGKVPIGGDNPVVVQSMCTEQLHDTSAIIEEIEDLAAAGAKIVRFAVRNMAETRLIPEVVKNTTPALCADIHFDHRLAVAVIENGVHKVRINPGNIGTREGVAAVVAAARSHKVPIRIGVNGGSLDGTRYPYPTAAAIVDSALSHIRILEELQFEDIVVSLKSSDVKTTVDANRLLAARRPYPLHLGVTEAGYGLSAVIKSSIAIGTLLLEGIGSTIRVSLTGDPREEVDAAYRILAASNRAEYGINIVSCPTCGRTDRDIDLRAVASGVESALSKSFMQRLAASRTLITVAVMGCEVNGPGEAAEADLGVAGAGRGRFTVFRKGRVVKKIKEDEIPDVLAQIVEEILIEHEK